MIKFLSKFLFLAFTLSYISLISISAQNSKVPSGWKKVSICSISFNVPENLQIQNAKGIDSCVASFGDNKIGLQIDYGLYGSASKKYETYVDFKEELIGIDGKKTQLATYKDTRMDKNRNFIARIYVALDKTKLAGVKMTESLNMTIVTESEKDLKTAMQIFRSIRFKR